MRRDTQYGAFPYTNYKTKRRGKETGFFSFRTTIPAVAGLASGIRVGAKNSMALQKARISHGPS